MENALKKQVVFLMVKKSLKAKRFFTDPKRPKISNAIFFQFRSGWEDMVDFGGLSRGTREPWIYSAPVTSGL